MLGRDSMAVACHLYSVFFSCKSEDTVAVPVIITVNHLAQYWLVPETDSIVI